MFKSIRLNLIRILGCFLGFAVFLVPVQASAKKPQNIPKATKSIQNETDLLTQKNKALAYYNEGVRLFLASQADAQIDPKTSENLKNLAGKNFQEAVKLNPKLLEAHSNLGFLKISQQAYKQALPYFEEALKLNAQHEITRSGYGITLSELKRFDEAVTVLKTLAQENPQNERHWYNLGAVYQKQNNFDDAQNTYIQVLLINPKHQPAIFNLGTLFHQFNDYKQAWVYYERCIQTEPGTPLALQAQRRLDFLKTQIESSTTGLPAPAKESIAK